MSLFASLHGTSTGILCELDSMNNRVYSGRDAVTRVEKAQALLLPADEADFHAYLVTPKVGRSVFDNPLAHATLPDLELDLGDAAF